MSNPGDNNIGDQPRGTPNKPVGFSPTFGSLNSFGQSSATNGISTAGDHHKEADGLANGSTTSAPFPSPFGIPSAFGTPSKPASVADIPIPPSSSIAQTPVAETKSESHVNGGRRLSIDESWVNVDWKDLQHPPQPAIVEEKKDVPLADASPQKLSEEKPLQIFEAKAYEKTGREASPMKIDLEEKSSAAPKSPMRPSEEPKHFAAPKSPVLQVEEEAAVAPKSPFREPEENKSTPAPKSPIRKVEEEKPAFAAPSTPIKQVVKEDIQETPNREPAASVPATISHNATPTVAASAPVTSGASTSKSTPKPRTPRQTAPSTPITPRSSSRVRKSVERLSPAAIERPDTKAIVIPSGEGTKLGDIPHIAKELAKHKADFAPIVTLHRVLYGRPGEGMKRKANLRLFHGIPDAEEIAKIGEKLDHHKIEELRDLAAVLNLAHSGEKKAVIKRICDFLHKPEDFGESKAAPKRTPQKRSKTASPASSARKSKTAKHDADEAPAHDDEAHDDADDASGESDIVQDLEQEVASQN